MNEYLYRYISFEMLVDMVQTQSLNFVLPSVWEDTQENSFLHSYYNSLSDYSRQIAFAFEQITYAQSWTMLSESDAMWRIYDYNSKSLRLKIRYSDAEKLNNTYVVPVVYENKQIDYQNSNEDIPSIMRKLIAQKRIAFKHEEEVRLIYVEKRTVDEILTAIKALSIIHEVYDASSKISLPDYDICKSIITEGTEKFNLNQSRKNQKVSFADIPTFIQGILVNPHAPEWYVQTVKKYCEINNIPFEGKSKLYEKN